jgi:hydroxymethylpyrimidine/phosphomethylpyrimidine kinase
MPTPLKPTAASLLQNKDMIVSVTVHCALTIAGSDSSGCAGIQADLKTFEAFGIHGLSAITAVTAQSMHEVRAIHRVPIQHVEQQLRAVFEEFPIGAVKIGMLGSAATIVAIAAFLRKHCRAPIVLDPVLVSSSGRRLLPANALAVLREQLIPLAEVLTPNVPEAAVLVGRRLSTADDLRQAGHDLLGLGAKSILLKGGHQASDPVCDYLMDATGTRTFRHARMPITARGTGCVLSAATAAGLARGRSRMAAVSAAEQYLQIALREAYRPAQSTIRALSVSSKHK